MKILLFVLSVTLNAALGAYIWLDSKKCEYTFDDHRRVDNARLEDIETLSKFFKGIITKDQAFSIVKNNFKSDEWFEKPEDNGIDVGRIFLIFDDKNTLKKIETFTMKNP